MNDAREQLTADIRKLTSDAFDQGAVIALRSARDGLLRICGMRPENAITAFELAQVMDDLISVAEKKK